MQPRQAGPKRSHVRSDRGGHILCIHGIHARHQSRHRAYLPISPYISPYLPISPYISQVLSSQLQWIPQGEQAERFRDAPIRLGLGLGLGAGAGAGVGVGVGVAG